MTATKPSVPGLARRLHGTYTIARAVVRDRGAPFLPAETLAHRRDERVRALVNYAAEHVPHYRDLFRREGLDPREIRSADDLEALPLLEKAEFQEAPERFRPRPQPDECVVLQTAGSTGQPVEVLRDRRSLLETIAYDERERAVESHFCGRRWRYGVVQTSNPGGSLGRIRGLYGRTSFRPFRPRLHMLSIADPPELVLREIDRLRPASIRGHGSYLDLLFRTALASGITIRGPKVVAYGADPMSTEGRKLIEDRFGIPVISRYGAAEAPKIGFFCERRSGFHLHEDLTHVSVVDRDGRRAKPGEQGEVVVSDLVNRGTVLLNYRLGDLATLLPDGCRCGRTSRRLSDLQGRLSALVELGDGAPLVSRLLEAAIDRHPGVLRFQIVQVERNRFDVFLVTTDEAAYARLAGPIAGALGDLLRGASVRVERRAELGGDGEKFRPVVALGARDRFPNER